MSNDKLLSIYLADHHAGSVLGRELARRCLSNNQGAALGSFLTSFLEELEIERAALEDLIQRVDGRLDRMKDALAWGAERVGRLKLNGQLSGYSDLSRLEEVEGLCLGVEGKLSMWRALKYCAKTNERLATTDFDYLIKLGEAQREELEAHRIQAAAIAFSTIP